MKKHLRKWMQTGRMQAIKEENYKGVDIYIRYHKGLGKFQFFFVSGKTGFNSAFAYPDTESAITAAKKRIEVRLQRNVCN